MLKILLLLLLLLLVLLLLLSLSLSLSLSKCSVYDTVFLFQGPGPNHEPRALEGCFVLAVT